MKSLALPLSDIYSGMTSPPAAEIENRAASAPGGGWQARLELQFQAAEGRTRLAHRRHHGPLLVQRIFHPEPRAGEAALAAEPCHTYVLHPPGGVVSGDELQLEVEIQARAHALLTTPAAGKFYRRAQHSAGGTAQDENGGRDPRLARLTQTLRVAGGVLEWLPQENIFYPESAVELSTRVQLDADARFIGWEIGCLGLPASGASLGEGAVRQSFELWQGEAPLLLERLNIERACLTARWGLAGHSALGTWLAFPASARQLTLGCAQAAALNCADMTLACTLVDGVLSCRGMAARADRLKQGFIDLWCALRAELLGRAAVPPRIWAT
jgi:urease accessory protein